MTTTIVGAVAASAPAITDVTRARAADHRTAVAAARTARITRRTAADTASGQLMISLAEMLRETTCIVRSRHLVLRRWPGLVRFATRRRRQSYATLAFLGNALRTGVVTALLETGKVSTGELLRFKALNTALGLRRIWLRTHWVPMEAIDAALTRMQERRMEPLERLSRIIRMDPDMWLCPSLREFMVEHKQLLVELQLPHWLLRRLVQRDIISCDDAQNYRRARRLSAWPTRQDLAAYEATS